MKVIKSVNNQYIKELSKLSSKKHIVQQGRYLAEGINVIEEALAALSVDTILVSDESLFTNFKNRILVPGSVIEKLSSNNSNAGAIAVCEIVETTFAMNSFNKVVVLDTINNPGNFGSIIRTARALGYEAVITLGNSVFKYNHKVISGSQGAIFGFPVIQIKGYEHNLEHKPYYFKLDKYSKTIEEVKPKGKFALVFGNEANGVSTELETVWEGEGVYIPVKGVESLSVQNAAAIALYKFM